MEKKKEPIRYIIRPLYKALGHGAATGIVLFMATIAALVLANSSWGSEWYHHFLENKLTISYNDNEFSMDFHHFINDGLMAIFFFLVGLEIKQEFLLGQLSTWRQASLPIGAALGGMVFPALLFLLFTAGDDAHGWGIPMATDIAFTLGLINFVKNRVARSAKVFVTSLAVVDDIGAVLVIAFFYTTSIDIGELYIAGGAMLLLMIANYAGVRHVLFYSVIGIGGIWVAFFYSGIHPTVAGILLAFTIPADTRISRAQFQKRAGELYEKYIKINSLDRFYNSHSEDHLLERFQSIGGQARAPLQKIESGLHGFVYFIVMPLFAFANAGLVIKEDFWSLLFGPIGVGVIVGLIAGKAIGITLFTKLLVAFNISKLPRGTTWRQVIGLSIMAGIGFTMSLFVADLAYTAPEKVDAAKSAIIVASALAAMIGLLFLKYGSDYDATKLGESDETSA